MKQKSSRLIEALRALKPKGRTQQQISKAIKRNNYWLWKQINDSRVVFSHLKQVCDELNCEIVIRSKTGRKLEFTVGKKSILWILLHITTKTQEQISEAIGADNGHLWDQIKKNNVRFNFLVDLCGEIDADIIIRHKDDPSTEYVTNPKEEIQ